MSINLSIEKCNNFFNQAAGVTIRKGYYTRIARNDFLNLNNTKFLVYTLLKSLANFSTQSINFYTQKRYLRNKYHKRTISRNLSSLVATGYMERIAPNEYGMVRNRRGRPVNLAFLGLIYDKETALLARFLLLLAYWRGDPFTLSVRQIRDALGIDTHSARVLAEWLRSRSNTLHKRTIRTIIFFCEKPDYWNHREGYRHRPERGYNSLSAWRYENATPEGGALTKEYLVGSNQYPGVPPGGDGMAHFKRRDKIITPKRSDTDYAVSNGQRARFAGVIANFETVGNVVADIMRECTQKRPDKSVPIMLSVAKTGGYLKKPPGGPRIPLPWLDLNSPKDQKTWGFFISGYIYHCTVSLWGTIPKKHLTNDNFLM